MLFCYFHKRYFVLVYWLYFDMLHQFYFVTLYWLHFVTLHGLHFVILTNIFSWIFLSTGGHFVEKVTFVMKHFDISLIWNHLLKTRDEMWLRIVFPLDGEMLTRICILKEKLKHLKENEALHFSNYFVYYYEIIFHLT